MTRNPEAASSGDRGPVLAAFRRALVREMHVLRRQPELLWQQLYNRLQWEDEPVRAVVEPDFERRSVSGASPWLRTRMRPRESEALIRTFEGHTGGVNACAVSPDGARVVSAGGFRDNTLKLWDAETGREVHTLEGHTSAVHACAYSPDGARVVSASGDQTLKLWDAETGRELRTLEGHTDSVTACAFSPDCARLVSASYDRTLKFWDAETGQEVHRLEDHSGYVSACAYSPDGARVVSASFDRTLKFWDAETGWEIGTLEGHTGGVLACAHSPDGARVVSASADATLKLWDAETGKRIPTLEGHAGLVEACAYSPDGARVISASTDKTLKLWDAVTGECITTLPLLGDARVAAHAPYRASVACGDEGGSLYLVDLVGIPLGPLVVSAVDLGNGPAVPCPVCRKRHHLQQAWLGREMSCPGRACTARWRVNPFIAGRRVPGRARSDIVRGDGGERLK